VEKVELPQELRMIWVTIENKAIYIQAEEDIVVYALNKEQFSTDGFLVFPVDVIGYEYYTVSHSPTLSYTEFALATKYDNTRISILLPNRRDAKPIRVEYQGDTYSNGDWLNITLNAFQAFQCASYDNADLTGSYILSDKPVALFSGNVRTFVSISWRIY